MEEKRTKETLQIMLDSVRGKELSLDDKERLEALDSSLNNEETAITKDIVIKFADSSVFTHSDQAAILMAINNLLTNDLHLVVSKISFVNAESDSSSNSADSINH